MTAQPVGLQPSFLFGEDFKLDLRPRRLRHGRYVLKLERIPLEILILLLEHPGEIVTRDEIVSRIWGNDVFLDTDNSIRGAIRKIRQVLKDDPETPRFIQTVTGRGYRFIAPVISPRGYSAESPSPGEMPGEEAAAPQPPQTEKDSLERLPSLPSPGRQWLLPAAIAVAAMIGLAAGYAKWSRTRIAEQGSRVRPMLAVLPFENLTGDPSQEYFSDGLTEEMIGQLGQIDPQRLGVIARTSSMHYKHTEEPVAQIARELGVQYVLEGSVRGDARRVRISAQLIQIKDQSQLWTRQYDRDVDAVLEVQDQIATEASDEIQIALGGSHNLNIPHPAKASGPASYEAYDLYLKGLYSLNKRTDEGLRQAADYFQKAIDRDPNYAQAYAGLANAFGLRSTWKWGPPNELMPKARAAALKALQLDGTLAEAHVALALVAEAYDYDWHTAEREFRTAIQLGPSCATAHQWYAEYLSRMGRFGEAMAESELARKIDPLSLIIATDHGSILYRARQYDQAIVQYQVVLEMESNFVHACGELSSAFAKAGRFDEALGEINRCIRPRSEAWACALEAIVYSEEGRTADAEKALARFEELGRRSPNDEMRTVIYSVMGRTDQAIALLQRRYKERSDLLYLKVDPIFDPLRDDPRFQDLLRELGLNYS